MNVRGVDSFSAVTESLILQATSALGVKPAFWGRYFTNVTATQAEYRHRVEGPLLAVHGIRVLPIARQTNRVHGSETDGAADGTANAADLMASFTPAERAAGVRLFLDVEGDGPSHLSTEYYRGWSRELAAAGVNACIYGIPGDGATWSALRSAMASGAPCGGVWLSHPYRAVAEPLPWSAAMLAPYAPIAGVPVLLWQYAFGTTFDRDLAAPNAPADWLESLPLPQG